MEKETYNDLKKKYRLLCETATQLEDQIYKCKDEQTVVLLRADYREVIQKKQAIYEQIITVTP